MAKKPHSHAWHTFPQGSKVLDTVSGMDGVVQNTHIIHSVEPAGAAAGELGAGRLIPLPNPVTYESVMVELENGETVERSPQLLLAI
jgi:hypothetical protein